MKRLMTLLVTVSMASVSCSADEGTTMTDDERINALLDRMTLAEKIGQLNQNSSNYDLTGPQPAEGEGRDQFEKIRAGLVGSMLNVTGAEATRKAQKLAVEESRLGIPMLFAFDVVHGYQTMFPIPLAEAASWDLEAIELSARIAAVEAAAAGLHWTFAPMVDISRDARWGRVMEGAGEDPFLGSAVARARVRGFQGDDLKRIDTITACAKHFAGYGLAEGGRDYNTVDISEDTLHNVVLPPFKAAVDAGVVTVMNSFNEIGGMPSTSSHLLQRQILKGDWAFDGFVVSDWGSIGELVPHGVAVDSRDAARLAFTAGSDMDMESDAYIDHLAELVRSGDVSESLVDDAVRRILKVKLDLGLFDDPYAYCDEGREGTQIFNAAHREAARKVARKSIVLLKNEDNILPLDPNKGSIAVIGDLADDKDSPLGSWRAKAVTDSAVSLLEGMEAAVGADLRLTFDQGAPVGIGRRSFHHHVKINENDRSGFEAAIEAARRADTVVIALGEEGFQSGEGRSRADIGLPGVQQELLEAVYAANSNVVVVLMNGRPLVLDWMAEHVPAIVEAWHLGSEAGHAIADILFGKVNPSGKLPMSFPRHVGQLPLYYNHKNTGRPTPTGMVFWSHYNDVPNTPLFPFGHGLSYTTFAYSDLQLSSSKMEFDDELQIEVTVKNTGRRAGAEVVQLYLRDLVGSTTRPVKELKGFEKIELEPGTSRKVTFTLRADDLAFYNGDRKWTAEPGEFAVFVGGSSQDTLEAKFRLE